MTSNFRPLPFQASGSMSLACRLALAATLLWWAALALAAPSVALFYGADAPLDELKAFDIVVVDPDHGYDPVAYRQAQGQPPGQTPGQVYSQLYAYVSVGEVHPGRPYYGQVPAEAKLAANAAWGSVVMDLSRPEWAQFLADKVVAPLWEKGYRGLFLDTLDSYRLAPKFDEKAQQEGLVRVVSTLHQRFPGISLILNRGFDVVPAVKDMVHMVAAESLYRRWDAANKRYGEVPLQDREWLLGQLLRVRDEFRIPVLAVDYVPPAERQLARDTAEAIKALGVIPWVADAGLNALGVGQVEVQPRKILALYDGREAQGPAATSLHRFAEMPLNHLGYTLEYADINQPLPAYPLPGRVAGLVLWVNGAPADARGLSAWLRRQVGEGMKLAILGQLRGALDGAALRALGLAAPAAPAGARLTVASQDAMFGLEAQPVPDKLNFQPLCLAAGAGQSLLEIADRGGQRFDGAALTPWGGYVLNPFVLTSLPGTDQYRWVVDPFAFLPRALGLAPLPAPDPTTENGRRLLFIHIDGQGLAAPSEFPGAPPAGDMLLAEMLQRYPLPVTMALGEGELNPKGLAAGGAAAADRLVRRFRELPYLDLAAPPRYQQARYSRPAQMAPPAADQPWLPAAANVPTRISRAYPSLAAVSPLGLAQPGKVQVYAAVADENLYTDFWRGPFYGYERVVETLQMTEKPRRLKPIHLNYHAYSASKEASLKALRSVYDWALAQPVHPVRAEEFRRKAGDFYRAVLARDGDTWLYRGDGSLRTLRAPAALGHPDLATATALAGFAAAGQERYLHLTGGEARLRFLPAAPSRPYLAEANGRLADWHAAGGGFLFTLQGHQPLDFALAQAAGCRVDAGGKDLAPRRSADSLSFFHLDHATAKIRVHCADR